MEEGGQSREKMKADILGTTYVLVYEVERS